MSEPAAEAPGTVTAAVPGAAGGLYLGPCAGARLTEEQLDGLKAEWRKRSFGPPRLLTPLPRCVRLRLAAWHVINGAGIWLVSHGHIRTAEWLWRLCSMVLSSLFNLSGRKL